MPQRIGVSCIVVLCLATSVFAGYDVGQDVAGCWSSNPADTTNPPMSLAQCPSGIDVAFIVPPPSIMRQDEVYPVTWRFYGPVGLQVVHTNVHSCYTQNGFCTPFVKATPGLSTQTPPLTGVVGPGSSADFQANVMLAKGYYTIIIHVKYNNSTNVVIDVARAVRGQVLPAEVELLVAPTLVKIVFIIACSCAGFLASIIISTLYFRKHLVLLYSQWPVCTLANLNAMVAVLGSLTLGHHTVLTSEFYCYLRPWVTELPSFLVQVCIFSKVFRVWRIYANTKMKKMHSTVSHMMWMIMVLNVVYILLLVPSSFISGHQLTRKYYDDVRFETVCVAVNLYNIETISLIGRVGAFLLMYGFGLWMTSESQKFTSLFNESQHLASGLQAGIILSAVVFPTIFTVVADPSAVFLLASMEVILVNFTSVSALMLPKFWLIYKKVKIRNFEIEDDKKPAVPASPKPKKTKGRTPLAKAGHGPKSNSVEKKGPAKEEVEEAKEASVVKITGGNIPQELRIMLEESRENLDSILRSYNSGLRVDKDDFAHLVSLQKALTNKLRVTLWVERKKGESVWFNGATEEQVKTFSTLRKKRISRFSTKTKAVRKTVTFNKTADGGDTFAIPTPIESGRPEKKAEIIDAVSFSADVPDTAGGREGMELTAEEMEVVNDLLGAEHEAEEEEAPVRAYSVKYEQFRKKAVLQSQPETFDDGLATMPGRVYLGEGIGSEVEVSEIGSSESRV